MSARARVMAALHGDPVDRIPVCIWTHNFAAENSARELSDETVRLAQEYDWDYLKPQSRAHCSAEMWGLKYAPSGRQTAAPTVIIYPLQTAGDLKRLRLDRSRNTGITAPRRIQRGAGEPLSRRTAPGWAIDDA